MNLTQTTLAQAAYTMAKSLGLRFPDDRAEVIENVNLLRNLIYNKYPQFPLFDNAFVCLPLCKIPIDCTKDICGNNFYWGATLPPNIASITAAWHNKAPLRLHSRWQEVNNGLVTEHGLECAVYPVDEQTVTFRRQKATTKMLLYAHDRNDEGKTVYMDVYDENNEQKRLELKLKGDGVVETPIPVKHIVSIVLPFGREGSVTLSQEDGYELSRYAPQEHVPLYTLIKVNVPITCECEGQSILIKGAKKYYDVYYDTDIVEISDPILLEKGAVHLRYRNSKERDEQILADRSLADLYVNLDGVIARHKGRARQSVLRFAPINRTTNLLRRW